MKDTSTEVRVLTYTVEHRKTYDTLCLLKARGYSNVKVYAKPYHYTKTFSPVYEHRPKMNFHLGTKEICVNFEYDYIEIDSYDEIQEGEKAIFLVCGAGLLPESLTRNHMVVNAHPGFIPNERGLDALKWAVVEDEPIGVTVHLIGDEVDAGNVFIREKIPVYENDTFHAVSQRVYEREVALLVEVLPKVFDKDAVTYMAGGDYIVHRRMPKDIEITFLDKFEAYKKKHAEKETVE